MSRNSSTGKWKILRWALRMAVITSAINAIPYGLHSWRSPSHPQLTYGAMVVIQFVTAFIAGVGADLSKPFATSRWRAGWVGAGLWLIVSQVFYWTILYVSFTDRQLKAFVVLSLCIGFIGGAVLWEPPLEDRYR